jgi:hypothetical protein
MKYLSPNAKFLIIFLIIIVLLSAILHPFLIRYGLVEGFHSTTYSTYSNNQSIDSGVSLLVDPTKETQCKKIFGFDGLFCNPDSIKGGLDVFYGLPSNSTCPGSGLTKSNGNVCLNNDAYNLLTTRGGNATGKSSTSGTKDSQIA